MLDLSPRQKRLGILFAVLGLLGGAGALAYVFPSESNQGYYPEQPIPFSHKLHAGQYKMECLYCHSSAEKSSHASVPAVSVCMNCHSVVKTDSPHIQKIREAYEKNQPIEWVRIHELPDHAKFPHKRHVAAGLQCQTCHGPIEQMERVYQYAPLNMGWCMQCHRGETTPRDVHQALYKGVPDEAGRKPVAPIQCNTCHY